MITKTYLKFFNAIHFKNVLLLLLSFIYCLLTDPGEFDYYKFIIKVQCLNLIWINIKNRPHNSLVWILNKNFFHIFVAFPFKVSELCTRVYDNSFLHGFKNCSTDPST